MVGKRKFGAEACCQCLARVVTVAEAKAVSDIWRHLHNAAKTLHTVMDAAISNVCAVN